MYARPRHRCEGRYKSFMQSFVKVVDLIRADRQSLETFLWERKPSNSVPPWTWYLEHPGTWNLRIPGIVYRISSDVHLSWQVFDEACEVFHALHETQCLQAGSIGEQVTDVCAFEWLEWNGQWKNHHLQNARQIAVMQRQLDSGWILPVSFECLSQLAFEAVLSFLPLSEVGGDTREWWWKKTTCLLC